MRVVLFAVLLSIVQTTPSVPKQAPGNPNQSTQKGQKDAIQRPKPIAQTPSSKDATEKTDNHGNPTAPNAEQTVRVRELPPVSVTSGWRDNANLVFSLLLIIVTAIQVYMLCYTLKFVRIQSVIMRRQTRHIARQALSMRRQTTHLKNSVIQAAVAANASKLSADALVSSQRAWLDGEFQAPSNTGDTWGTWNLVAKNHGATPAQLLRHECSFHAEGKEFEWDSYDKKDTRNWGTLLGAGQLSEPLQTITPDSFFAFLRERGMGGTASCTVAVIIAYRDVINPTVEHKTKFLIVYNRTSKTISRLSQYNEYT